MTMQRHQMSLQRPPKVVMYLMIANVAIWVLFALFISGFGSRDAADAYVLLTLQPESSTFGLELWRLFSYGFLHELSGLMHIGFNMLALYFLGTPLAQRWGGKAFLRFYLIAMVGAGIFTALVGLLLPTVFGVAVVGASGAIFALLAAFSMLFPTAELLLLFVIPVKARHVIWIAVAIDIVLFTTMTDYGVAIHTHMGGAIAGWLLVTGNWHPVRAWGRFRRRQARKNGPPKGGAGGLRSVEGGKPRYIN